MFLTVSLKDRCYAAGITVWSDAQFMMEGPLIVLIHIYELIRVNLGMYRNTYLIFECCVYYF